MFVRKHLYKENGKSSWVRQVNVTKHFICRPSKCSPTGPTSQQADKRFTQKMQHLFSLAVRKCFLTSIPCISIHELSTLATSSWYVSLSPACTYSFIIMFSFISHLSPSIWQESSWTCSLYCVTLLYLLQTVSFTWLSRWSSSTIYSHAGRHKFSACTIIHNALSRTAKPTSAPSISWYLYHGANSVYVMIRATSILHHCTAPYACTSYYAVGSHVPCDFNLILALAMSGCRLNDKLAERVPCRRVQTVLVT